MKKSFNTPILFIVFNRPDTTKKVFGSIRKLKPKQLYIAADGPRSSCSGESDLCQQTRNITENIDWKCDVHRLYRKSNLGCGKSVSGAINWFFRNVEQGIILEDDCLPNKSFYGFCEEMLIFYKDNYKIMHISGDNFLRMSNQNKDIYYFSKYAHVWGWATWKRAWKKYDFDMKDWDSKKIFTKMQLIEGGIWEKLFWVTAFESVSKRFVDTWDYQWIYSIFKNNGLSVVPGVNLVRNMGFGSNSTHTKKTNVVYENLKTTRLSNNLKNDVLNSKKYDHYESINVFKVRSSKTLLSFLYYVFVLKLANKS